MKREGIAALALIVVIVAMMFTGCRGMNESSSSSSITQVKVVVDCNGTWTGNIGALNS